MTAVGWEQVDRKDIIINESNPSPCCGYIGFTIDNAALCLEISKIQPDGSMRVMIITTVHCPQCKQQYQNRMVLVTRPSPDNLGEKAFAVYDAEEVLRCV